jgi:hypothetical protein
MVASCNHCEPAEAPKDAAPSATVSAAPVEDAAPRARDASVATPVDAGPIDAGSSACRLAYGPAEQTFRGPAALVVTTTELRLVANDSGKPKIYSVPLGAQTPPKPTSFVGMRWPPCEVAGKWAYCPGPGGIVNRSTIEGEALAAVAKSRPGTRIAAGAVGPQHSVVAFLDSKRTSEGELLQAFVVLDHGEVERLSEEGAGATTVQIVPRGDGALAAYLDTRTSMVPVHARPIGANGDKLALGADAVVFVGGAPDRGIDFTIAATKKDAFVLLPIAHESADFGMAAIPLHDPPKTDVSAVWSMYPNGLDPAPIAAAGSFVARVRPREREPGSPRILELGRIDEAGAFTSFGAIADGRRITDIAMATDKDGVWILYGDTGATFLERRVCP